MVRLRRSSKEEESPDSIAVSKGWLAPQETPKTAPRIPEAIKIPKAAEAPKVRKPRKPLSKRRVAKIAAFFTLGLFVLWVILTFLAYAYNIEVEPFRSLWLFVDRFVDVGSLGLIGEYVLFFLPTTAAWVVFLSLRRREKARKRVEARREAEREKKLDDLFDDLESQPETKPIAKPTLAEEDEDLVSDEDVKRIILSSRRVRYTVRNIVKAAGFLFCLVFLYYLVTDFDGTILIGILVIYYFTLFLWLLQNETLLMVEFFSVFAAFAFLYYAIPYRLTRKQLKVVDAGKIKELGRVRYIKGVDEWGYPYRSLLYNVWAMKRFLQWAFSHPEKPWRKSRPSPHEFPWGDVYYLKGRKVKVSVKANGGPAVDTEKVEQFRRCIILQSNTDNIIKRKLHPIPLYTNAKLDVGWTTITAVDDGCKIHFIPRSGPDSVSHFELTTKGAVSVERDLVTYRNYVDSSVENAAKVVLQGVKADSELQKDSQRRFLLPSSRTLAKRLGHRVDEKGNVTSTPEEK